MKSAEDIDSVKRKKNKTELNAEIAMARFKVQSYNWKKTTKALMKIYGVGGTFVTKMRREVGYVDPRERYQEMVKKFLATPEHHEIEAKEIERIYEVSMTASKRMACMVGKTHAEKIKERLDRLIYSHPDFGTPGQRAEVSLTKIADELKCCTSSISSRRKIKGVLPAFTAKPPSQRPEMTYNDRKAFKVCRLTHNWGRPKGMAEHLETLNG